MSGDTHTVLPHPSGQCTACGLGSVTWKQPGFLSLSLLLWVHSADCPMSHALLQSQHCIHLLRLVSNSMPGKWTFLSHRAACLLVRCMWLRGCLMCSGFAARLSEDGAVEGSTPLGDITRSTARAMQALLQRGQQRSCSRAVQGVYVPQKIPGPPGHSAPLCLSL